MKRLGADGQHYDVSGRAMYIDCIGNDGPTVVIEPGAGSWSAQWTHIQEELTEVGRVCVYDRAGLGLSDAFDYESSGQNYVRDLHKLLTAANEQPPFVLVGHSLGGYLARLYYTEFPGEVAGIVLADAAHENQWEELPPEMDTLMSNAIGQMRAATWMTRFGFIRAMGLPDQGMPTEDQESAVQSVMMTAKYWKSTVSEFEAGMDIIPDEVRASENLNDLPLLVISSARSADTYCATDGSAGVSCVEAQAVWDRLQAELTTLSSTSRQVTLADATHTVYLDAPDELASHIGQFVASLRPNMQKAGVDLQ